MSPEEDAQLEAAVALSGLTKQDYIIRRLQCRDVVVQGNPRVYKALRNQLSAALEELQRIAVGESVDADLLDTIKLIAVTMSGLKDEAQT
jgi:acid stress-induced BolA-like protein IbaG/YrbA